MRSRNNGVICAVAGKGILNQRICDGAGAGALK